jgi:PDZ domain-containing protein
MSRRSLTLAIAGLATVAAIVVAVLVPVPYVILMPGPTLNTLGKESGQPLISITGRQTYPTTGNLNMVTISYTGGPGMGMNVIEAVDGTPVTGETALSTLITAHPVGTTLQLTVLRAGKTLTIPVASKSSGGTAVIGVKVQQQYKFPFNVNITVGNIGGPSAGMMFALGIIDKLTNDNLTGGKFIAGTGEITAAGQVEAIGGIQQKMVGARDAGATVFLAPAGNCSAVEGSIPAGLKVVKVSTLSGAITDLDDLKAGKPVPAC